MLCALCGGELKKDLVVHDEHRENDLYSFNDVPALVCQSCGEVWLTDEVARKIDLIIATHQEPEEYKKVPVFSLSKLA